MLKRGFVQPSNSRMITWVKDGIGVLESAVNIGIVNQEQSSFLIDTGIDNSAINKVMKEVDFEIDGALITHHHADHMGGCSKLETLGITKLYGPESELELMTNPYLEPFTMFGGSHPPKKLRNRHLEAKPSKSIKPATDNQFGQQILCPGHSPGHTAYLIDDVLYSGDAAFTAETIDKYNLLFAVNPKQAAESLKNIEKSKFSVMIPGHGPISHDRKTALDVINATKAHYIGVRGKILSIVKSGIPYSEYIPFLMKELELDTIISERGLTQYFLYQVPLSGYLSNLIDDKLINLEVEQGKVTVVVN